MSLRSYLKNQSIESISQTVSDRFVDTLLNKFRYYAGLDGVSSFQFRRERMKITKSVIDKILIPTRRRKIQKSISRFRFTPFKEKLIPKDGLSVSSTRPIRVSSISGLIAQTVMCEYMQTHLESKFLPSSYAYRKGKSAKKAVRAVKEAISAGKTHIFEGDIQDFFGSVNHDLLIQRLKKRFKNDKLLHLLVYRFLKTGKVRVTNNARRKHIRKLKGGYCENHVGIPQGGMLSGILANLLLGDLDTVMQEQFPDLTYIRYADDFVLLARDEKTLKNAADAVESTLKTLCLTFNTNKTRLLNLLDKRRSGANEHFDFLGYRFANSRVSIKPQNVQKMKSRIEQVIQKWQNEETSLESLIWRINKRIEGNMLDAEGLFIGRNWTRYFSLISHHGQLKELDIWLCKRTLFAVRKKNHKITKKELLNRKIRSFVRLHFLMKTLAMRRIKNSRI